MKSFIQDLSLNFHFLLDLFLHHNGNSSSSWQALTVSTAMLRKATGSKIYISPDVSIKPIQKNPYIWTVQSNLLIPEQILLIYITLTKLDNVSYITYWISCLKGQKWMDSEFQVLSNIYFGAEYKYCKIYKFERCDYGISQSHLIVLQVAMFV